jgi:hypothetical protein
METILSIIAIVLSVISGGFSLYSFVWTARRDRKQATLDAYNQIQEQAFDKLNTYSPAAIREIAKDSKSEEYKTVSGYIARIEHFCVGVNQNIYDRRTVYALAHGYLDGQVLKRRMEPIIDKKQIGASEDYYENIHAVLNWMEKESHKRKRN